jgi:hypothetical protein
MPDGVVVNFPDDMPQGRVRDMIATKFPHLAQQEQPKALPTRPAPTHRPGERTFQIQAPDGRKISVSAADEATAMRGAQEWAAANPMQAGGPQQPGKQITVNIGGRRVKVGAEFMQMSPDQQNAAIEEIAASIGGAPGPGNVASPSPQFTEALSAGSNATQMFDRAKQAMQRFEIGMPDGQTFEIQAPSLEAASAGMSELERIGGALQKANAAGNADDARQLEQAYQRLQMQLGIAPAQSGQSAQPARPDLAGSTAATLGGIVNGIPVIGPMAQNASDALMGAGAALTGGDYGETVQGLQQRRAGLARANPVANVAGNLAGGVGAYGALAKTGAATALGFQGGLLSRVGNSTASGGVISAADTAFKGGSPEEILSSGVYGAGTGAVTPLLASAFSTTARAIGNKIAPAWAAATRPGEEAARRTGQAVLRDRNSGADTLFNSADDEIARQAGIPLMNVDRGGETTRALARSVANQNPEARSIITKAADERFNTQGLRAIDMVKRVAGGSADDLAYQQNIREIAKFTNGPKYRAAFEAPAAQAVWSPQIRQLMQSPMFRSAVKMAESRGADKAAISGFSAVKNPFSFGPNGAIGLRTNPDGSRALPSLAFWNQVKVNLDGMIERAQRGAKPDRALYADLVQMKNMLVSDLDAAVPQYRAARQGAASFFDADDALEAGKKFATQPRSVPEATRAFNSFGDAEKTAFRTGYASEIIDRIRSTRDRANVVQQVFGNQSSRDMMKLVFGPARAQELEAYVRIENLADLIRGQLGGSTTARQLVELGIGTGLGSGVGFYSTGGSWQGALAGAAIGGGRRASQMLGQRVDAKVMEHVAKLLTSRNPADLRHAVHNAAMSPKWMDAISALEQVLMIGPRASMPQAVGQ